MEAFGKRNHQYKAKATPLRATVHNFAKRKIIKSRDEVKNKDPVLKLKSEEMCEKRKRKPRKTTYDAMRFRITKRQKHLNARAEADVPLSCGTLVSASATANSRSSQLSDQAASLPKGPARSAISEHRVRKNIDKHIVGTIQSYYLCQPTVPQCVPLGNRAATLYAHEHDDKRLAGATRNSLELQRILNGDSSLKPGSLGGNIIEALKKHGLDIAKRGERKQETGV